MAIYFFTSTDEYGFLSNFSRHEFELDGHRWPTVEHYFQAQKFPGTPLFGRIRNAPGPKDAKALGRTRDVKIRPDWDDVRDEVMRRAIWRKFEVHADLAARLLATGDEELIENAPNDYYWGCGADGTGLNMTGKLLMGLRTELRKAGDGV